MMKKILLSFFACALATTVLQAQQKILTVNMAECFDAFHETATVNDRMESLKQSLEADLQARQQALQEKVAPIQERILEIQQNPGLSDEAKQSQLSELQVEVDPIQQEERELQQYAREKQEEYRQKFLRSRQNLIDKIKNVATTIAIREGAQLLLDTADVTGSGVAPVIYRDQSLDITSKVIAELNKSAGEPNPAPAE